MSLSESSFREAGWRVFFVCIEIDLYVNVILGTNNFSTSSDNTMLSLSVLMSSGKMYAIYAISLFGCITNINLFSSRDDNFFTEIICDPCDPLLIFPNELMHYVCGFYCHRFISNLISYVVTCNHIFRPCKMIGWKCKNHSHKCT